jgi:hypothetical protein
VTRLDGWRRRRASDDERLHLPSALGRPPPIRGTGTQGATYSVASGQRKKWTLLWCNTDVGGPGVVSNPGPFPRVLFGPLSTREHQHEDEAGRVMSLPGKPKGIDGGEVEALFPRRQNQGVRRLLRDGHSQYVPGVAANGAASEALFDAGRPDQPLVRTQFGSDVYVHICGRHRHRIDSELLQPLLHRRRGQHLGGS